MPNYEVALEAAWLVKDVQTPEDAIGVAISEIGKRLNPDLKFVEVDVGSTACPACGEMMESVFITANTALVGLMLEMKVFDAESEEHAERISKSVIGKVLKTIPLNVLDVTNIDDRD